MRRGRVGKRDTGSKDRGKGENRGNKKVIRREGEKQRERGGERERELLEFCRGHLHSLL